MMGELTSPIWTSNRLAGSPLRLSRISTAMMVVVVCCATVTLLYITNGDKTESTTTGLSKSSGPRSTVATSAVHRHSDDTRQEDFLFHAGKNSIGGDLAHVTYKLSINQFKVLCHQTEGCVGFTTNGHLKKVIQPRNEWKTIQDKRQGLYTLDTNHCYLYEGHSCSVGKTCLNEETNGTYTCESIIHIGMSIDSKVIDGVIAVIQSLIDHSSKNRIIIHMITSTTDEKIVKDRIDCSLNLPSNLSIDYKTFNVPDKLKQLIIVTERNAEYLANAANYARFYLAIMFPQVSHMIYLDADLVVKNDIGMLWREVMETNKLLVVVPRKHKCTSLNQTTLSEPFYKRYRRNFSEALCPGFNAGVFGINLKMWRDNNMLEEVFYWLKINKKKHIWRLGTQPLMYILSYENWKGVADRWNLQDLYTFNYYRRLKSSYIVHWSGRDKPWGDRPRKGKVDKQLRKYDKVWDKYKRDQCSNHGVCKTDDPKKSAYCICKDGYTGRLCNETE